MLVFGTNTARAGGGDSQLGGKLDRRIQPVGRPDSRSARLDFEIRPSPLVGVEAPRNALDRPCVTVEERRATVRGWSGPGLTVTLMPWSARTSLTVLASGAIQVPTHDVGQPV